MNFFELEKECKKRRLRRLLISISIFLFFLIFLSLLFWTLKSKVNKKTSIRLKVKEVNKSLSKVSKVEKKSDKNKSEFLLKPIIDLNFSLKKEEKNGSNSFVQKTINRSDNFLTTSNMPSFEECIQKAIKFYNEGNYEEAIKWAKNANLQNKKDARSWIIVAKSLYKLGKKNKAINILKIYFSYTKDKKVLKIIDRMESGKI